MIKTFYNFSEIARTYGNNGQRTKEALTSENIKRIAEIISEHAGKKQFQILDMGCGGGQVTNWLNENTGNSTVIGIDEAEAQINVAIKDYSHTQNQIFLVGNCHRLPFADQSFDAVYENSALCWSKNPESFILEAIRCTRNLTILSVLTTENAITYWGGYSKLLKWGPDGNIELTFDPMTYQMTELHERFLAKTNIPDTYKYPVWLQPCGTLSETALESLLRSNNIEIVEHLEEDASQYGFHRKNEEAGPPEKGDDPIWHVMKKHFVVLKREQN